MSIALKIFVAALLPISLYCQPLQAIAQTGLPRSLSRQSDQRFLGQWAFMVGKRTMMVLDLEPGAGDQPVTGTLTGPKTFQTKNFSSFNHVQGPTRVKKITAAKQKGDSLLLTVQNPDDATDTDIWEFTRKDDAHAELHLDAPGMNLPSLAFVRLAGTVAVYTDWDADQTYSIDDGAPSNPEMKRIFEEDQAARQDLKAFFANGAANEKADKMRQQQVLKLLADGALHSAEDFNEAAFVFQHGSRSDDYLLAHTLAMVAVRKGNASAIWIASATLDRYLDSVKQPQIYGTQFHTPKGQATTQEPYNRTLISDALRKELDVPSLAEQEKQREGYNQQLNPGK